MFFCNKTTQKKPIKKPALQAVFAENTKQVQNNMSNGQVKPYQKCSKTHPQNRTKKTAKIRENFRQKKLILTAVQNWTGTFSLKYLQMQTAKVVKTYRSHMANLGKKNKLKTNSKNKT